jgi:hypothetical protein
LKLILENKKENKNEDTEEKKNIEVKNQNEFDEGVNKATTFMNNKKPKKNRKGKNKFFKRRKK